MALQPGTRNPQLTLSVSATSLKPRNTLFHKVGPRLNRTMAKELTHILIAQDVVKQLRRNGQTLLAQLIERNIGAYYLGSIIPDALFYDVYPLRLNPEKYVWLSRAFHKEETAKNDQQAVSLFRSVEANPRVWRLKMAFAAGIITHTVIDRIFHELIEYYTSTWGEGGSVATATHREIETLIDMILLRPLNMTPRQINLAHFIQLDERTKYSLFGFYLDHLVEDHKEDPPLLNTLRRSHDQQCLFIKLFATLPLYHIIKLTNKLVAGRLVAWHSLFYPEEVGPQTFPVFGKMGVNSLKDERLFDGGLGTCREAASNEAISHINMALKAFA